MATQKFINNYRTILSATYGVADTTFTVESVEGLPELTDGDWFLLTLFRLNGVEESGHEVVKVTSRSGMVLTGTRAVEGAAPTVFVAGDIVAARMTAASIAAKADQTEVDLKANAADVYTKAETYSKTEADNLATTTKNEVVNGAPTALNNLDAIAAAINDDPNMWTTLLGLLAAKANLNSPTFTGTPLVPTAGTGTNTLQAASTAFVKQAVDNAIAALLNSAPGALDTLNELAAAIGNDPNFATTVTNNLATKAAKGVNSDITSLTGLTTALSAPQGGTGQGVYAVGDLLYASATNALSKLAGNTTTTRKFLSGTGTGSAGTAPVWNPLAATDIPDLDWAKITTGKPTTLEGFSTTASTLTLSSAAPTLSFTETDQAGAAGKWRMRAEGDTWFLQKNTAAAGDFTTAVFPYDVTSAGVGRVNGAVPVQQGTGVGQGTNTVKIGWGTSNGLKVTVDSTDQGFVPFSSTNPTGGTVTFPALTATATNVTTLTASGAMTANSGLSVTGSSTAIFGGNGATLANGGFLQIGGSGGLNVVMDYQTIQARNNGGTNNLLLNFYGGSVIVGGSSANNANFYTNGSVNATAGFVCTATSAIKYQMAEGGTSRGFIAADSTNCLGIINAANNAYRLTLTNAAGDLAVTGNITAYSDERLKSDWQPLYEGPRVSWLRCYSEILHGTFLRTDTQERQLGAGAQSVQALMPLAVTEVEQLDKSTILSLDYGKAALVAGVETAAEVVDLHARIVKLEALVASLTGGVA